jgi:glycosyltransferase involved in cell wall biosynthesis
VDSRPPQVSIYIVTRNRARLLRRALNSVLAQTFQDFEVLIVDDCSSDATMRYIRVAAHHDPRIRYFRNSENLGINASRNTALRAARGEFATGLDDDDEITPSHIQLLIDSWFRLNGHPETLSCLYFDYRFRIGDTVGGRSSRASRTTLRELPFGNTPGGHVFAPLAHFIQAGLYYPAMPMWADYEFYFRLLKLGPAALADQATYIYDVSPRSDRISMQKKARLREAWQIITERYLAGDRTAQQALLFQIHAPHFGHPVSLSELVEYASFRPWGFGIGRMAWYCLRRRRSVDALIAIGKRPLRRFFGRTERTPG